MAASIYDKVTDKHIPALNGLRAIAVGLVIFYHLGYDSVPGAHGVMTFFVISGFLITWLLLVEFENTGRISLRDFYVRRTLRIFPAFYIFLFGWIALLILTGRSVQWAHAVSAFFYVSNYYNGIHGDPNTGFSHTWSLAIEEQFYLIWPSVFIFLVIRGFSLIRVLCTMIVFAWIYRAILCFGFDVYQGYVYAAFDTRYDSLLVGCLLAVIIRQRAGEGWVRLLTSGAGWAVVSLGLILIVIYLPDLAGITIPRYRDVFEFAVLPPLIAVFIAQLVSNCQHWLWKWLEWPAIQYLGKISYSLYLYQQVVLEPVTKLLRSSPEWFASGAAVCATILVASMSYFVVEKPFLRLKERFR